MGPKLSTGGGQPVAARVGKGHGSVSLCTQVWMTLWMAPGMWVTEQA